MRETGNITTGDWAHFGTLDWGKTGETSTSSRLPASPSPIFPDPHASANQFNMIASMPVIPHCLHLFQDCQDLCQFLLNCQQTLTAINPIKIVSISLEIPSVDPLAILQHFYVSDRVHFYSEKKYHQNAHHPGQDLAIAAFDSSLHFTLEGRDRFSRAQKFMASTLENTIAIGATHLPFAGPHFFCTFTFFDENITKNAAFPAATIFLPTWQITRQNNHCILVINTQLNAQSNVQTLSHSIWRQIQTMTSPHLLDQILTDFASPSPAKHQINLNNPHQFQKSVIDALKSIRANHFTKIVLSHAIDVTSTRQFSLTNSLHNLRNFYPDCYIFSTSNGKGKNFIGASPERLIRIQDGELITDALAGSAPRGKTPAEDIVFANSLLCSEKDLREHRVVIDFIMQRLVNLGLTPHCLPSPHLLQLSNIQHLRTPITSQVSANIHLLEILAELHPTPAVAGLPRDIAKSQIRHYENFDRSLFAAPLGWVDHQGNGEFFVGIRSALIDGDRARLYAGAGIVEGSEPDKEFAEIQLKLQALLNALV